MRNAECEMRNAEYAQHGGTETRRVHGGIIFYPPIFADGRRSPGNRFINEMIR